MIDTGYAMRDVTVCWETECQQRQLDQLRAENERLAARVELLCQKIWG
jgi:cell division protein FtsB